MKREIGRLWQCKKVIVIPIIIGALFTVGRVSEYGLEKNT